MDGPEKCSSFLQFEGICQDLRDNFPDLIGDIEFESWKPVVEKKDSFKICEAMINRLNTIKEQAVATIQNSSNEVELGVNLFLNWMKEGTIVRVIGAGRARLAASIPANRLAHGGARVYIQGGLIPMPHTIKGGGIIASSASGKTPSVLNSLKSARTETKDLKIVGIASTEALEFKSLCDIFIGIQPTPQSSIPLLRALADCEEYVISEILDAMVVAAGKKGGFKEAWWKLGHENLGTETGPYDFKK